MYPLASRRLIGGMGVGAGSAVTWTPATAIGGLFPALWVIAGVENYQEATPVTPADNDGEAIGFMYDQSAANNDLVRDLNDTRRPTLKENIIGGNPVARFNSAANQNMNIPNTIIAATGFYWFVVAKMTDNAASYTILAEMDGTRRAVLYATTSKFEVRYFTGAAYISGSQTFAVDVNAHVLTYEHTGAAVNLYVDGVLGTGTGSSIVDTSVRKRLGFSNLGTLKGDVAEAICYIGTLTEAQRQQVEGYLTAKFF